MWGSLPSPGNFGPSNIDNLIVPSTTQLDTKFNSLELELRANKVPEAQPQPIHVGRLVVARGKRKNPPNLSLASQNQGVLLNCSANGEDNTDKVWRKKKKNQAEPSKRANTKGELKRLSVFLADLES